MFGDKDRRITSLEAQVDDLSGQLGEYEALGPYINIARELSYRVGTKIAEMTDGDLDKAMTDAIAEIEAEKTRQAIDNAIAQLPVERLLGIYAQVLGDEAVLMPLKEKAEIERRNAERQARLAAIKREALVSRQLDLRNIEQGEIVSFGMFISVIPDRYKGFAQRDNAGRILSGRKRDADGPTPFEVIDDRVRRMNSANLSNHQNENVPFEDHTMFGIGTVYGDKLEPVLTHGTHFTVETKKGWRNIQGYDIGFVAVGKTVLLDKPQGES